MARLLFIIAIVAALYLLVRSFRKQAPQQDRVDAVEDMVRCAHCGVHLPRSEGVEADGQFFCSTEHRDAGRN